MRMGAYPIVIAKLGNKVGEYLRFAATMQLNDNP